MAVGSGNGDWWMFFWLRQWLHGGGWAAQVGGGMVAEGCLLVGMCAGCRRFLAGWRTKGLWIWRSLAVQVLELMVADGGCVGRRHHGGSGGGDWGTWWLLGQQQGGDSDGSATRGQQCNEARRQQCNGGNEGGFSGRSSHVKASRWQYFSGAWPRQQLFWVHLADWVGFFWLVCGSGNGERKPLEHFLKAADEVSAKDIASIPQKLISSPLTMASHGAESCKIIFNFRRIFSKISLFFILPLSLIFLANIAVSDSLSSEGAVFWLVEFIYLTLLLLFFVLSTSAVVYTVASVYTGYDVTFGNVKSVIPKVWKRLMVTFLCAFLSIFLCNVLLLVPIILWRSPLSMLTGWFCFFPCLRDLVRRADCLHDRGLVAGGHHIGVGRHQRDPGHDLTFSIRRAPCSTL
ncbi:hypothetical protein RHSIM_Rhsim05G0028900 [Rhododendron simsii]|uniref:Uncharacterized protein n=1 Tax=Rhododendron simsii TaxID=118357 RepID=A0A834LM27_RHOSS|nr:hypothetical protein RHSIM_Rhsim05G0028900 [Rhododendron simsii]